MKYSKELNNLRQLFTTGYRSSLPKNCMATDLPKRPRGKLIILSFGKAAFTMAKVAEEHYGSEMKGYVVIPESSIASQQALKYLQLIVSSHPIPSYKSIKAGKLLMNSVKNLTTNDMVLFLISGGGSALVCLPKHGVTLEDKISITKSLLYSGASITEINLVRRHLSAIKGGKLALSAFPAQCYSLAISDVPDNNPLTIASGPTVHDTSKVSDAIEVLKKYCISVSSNIKQILKLKNDDKGHFIHPYKIIASSKTMLQASKQLAIELNYQVKILGVNLEGEAKKLGELHGVYSLLCQSIKPSGSPPLLLLSGGETSVTIQSKNGIGGRNTEYLLALANKIHGQANIYACSADSDGIDGSSKSAGAIIYPNTLNDLKFKNLNAETLLQTNNSWIGFLAINSLINTGATGTNVNDFRAILIT